MKTMRYLLLCVLFGCSLSVLAQEGGEGNTPRTDEPPATGPMNNKRIDELLRRLDEDVQGAPGHWRLNYQSAELMVITDEAADRLRVMTPAAHISELSGDVLFRMLQANFDSVLDARYAIAKDVVWSVFVHPLSSLTDRDFFSGLAQTIIATKTFGTTYTSGGLTFRGGDSEAEQKKLYDRIMREGETL